MPQYTITPRGPITRQVPLNKTEAIKIHRYHRMEIEVSGDGIKLTVINKFTGSTVKMNDAGFFMMEKKKLSALLANVSYIVQQSKPDGRP